jgi:hypothetical protein
MTAVESSYRSGIKSLIEAYYGGSPLPLGQIAKIIHLLPNEDQLRYREEITEAQKSFWCKWTDFRCGLKEPNFDSVVGLLPVRREFAKFMNHQKRDLIVDLAGGSAAQAPYIWGRKKGLGYIVIDSNPLIEDKARRTLTDLGIENSDFILHDLSKGLPRERLATLITSTLPERIHYTSMWGISYLEAPQLQHLITECLDPENNQGKESVLNFCMITEGKFDPHVLNHKFKTRIVPWRVVTLRLSSLKMAKAAIPEMMVFGHEIAQIMPIWTAEEIESILEEGGHKITDRNSSMMWRQAAAFKIASK